MVKSVIKIIAELDCLCSFSLVSFKADGTMTRPKIFFDPLIEPLMEIRGARHPFVALTGVNIIPNDIVLGKNPKSLNKYFIFKNK